MLNFGPKLFFKGGELKNDVMKFLSHTLATYNIEKNDVNYISKLFTIITKTVRNLCKD